jgi:hypothetical protein
MIKCRNASFFPGRDYIFLQILVVALADYYLLQKIIIIMQMNRPF